MSWSVVCNVLMVHLYVLTRMCQVLEYDTYMQEKRIRMYIYSYVFHGLEDVIARKIMRNLSSNSTFATSITNQSAFTLHSYVFHITFICLLLIQTSNLKIIAIRLKFLLSSLWSHVVRSNNKTTAIYTYSRNRLSGISGDQEKNSA